MQMGFSRHASIYNGCQIRLDRLSLRATIPHHRYSGRSQAALSGDHPTSSGQLRAIGTLHRVRVIYKSLFNNILGVLSHSTPCFHLARDSSTLDSAIAFRKCAGIVVNRRKFLVQSGSIAALSLLEGKAEAKAPARRPNVLLVMSDEHNRRCMGCSGDRTARTPNLDQLASTGTRFTQAYCTNPVCTPSRASLLTGLYSHHLQAQNNTTPYSPERKTLAHHFGAAGYMTGLIGKMHWVDAQTHGFDYHLDFNDWFQFLGPHTRMYANELGQANSGSGLPQIDDLWREEGDPWKGHRTLDSREGSVAVGRVSLMPEEDHFESFVARESNRFLTRFGRGEQPFFLITSFLKPHDPFMPAKRFAEMFRWQDMQLPSSWGKADLPTLPEEVQRSIRFNGPTPELRDPVEAKKRLAMYYANLAQMDDALGQVLATLRGLNLENDTIVCYTSDHGDMLGELGLWQKFEFYEGSCGVPLILRVPGQMAAVADTPVSLVNVCTTLADLATVPLVAPNDGKSMKPLIDGAQNDFGPVYAEYGLGGKQPKTMLRDGDWKFTLWEHEIPELYNLRSDPQELHNLAAQPQHAERIAEMKTRIRRWQVLPPPYAHA